ncbi:hypothetical protein AAG570_000271 [Ranatra chinensis]|uniref:Uncharacterized protein n=1 Tax=Ranatra chinensis TaxID=642074 RepID=A0ABD0ZJV8_9HEMI
MRAVHESVVEEMEAEIKLSRLKAQDAKEKYERRMSKLHDDLRDVIEVAETSLADRTVCKDDAVGEIIWMVKKINSAGIEIPKPHERGVSSWQAYENVQFGLKGVFDNSEKTRANLFSEELLSGGDYEGVEEYVEEEEEEEDEVVNDDGTSLSSSEDEIIEGALRTLKSKVGIPAPVHNKHRQLAPTY